MRRRRRAAASATAEAVPFFKTRGRGLNTDDWKNLRTDMDVD